jgi:hypothetical protein
MCPILDGYCAMGLLILRNGLQWVTHDTDEELLHAIQNLKSWQMM